MTQRRSRSLRLASYKLATTRTPFAKTINLQSHLSQILINLYGQHEDHDPDLYEQQWLDGHGLRAKRERKGAAGEHLANCSRGCTAPPSRLRGGTVRRVAQVVDLGHQPNRCRGGARAMYRRRYRAGVRERRRGSTAGGEGNSAGDRGG